MHLTENVYHARRRMIILLGIILFFGGLVRVFSFSGCFGSDDLTYADLAYQIANNAFEIGDNSEYISRLRIGLLVPVALGFKVTGPNEIALIIYPFTVSMLGIILAFFTGRAFFNDRVGLIAATLQSVLPFDARSASMLEPDLSAAFWANVGVLLLFYGSSRLTWPSKLTFAGMSGLALGFAWLTKESIGYLFLLIGVYLVWISYRQRRNLVLLVGTTLMITAVLMVESLTYYIHTGDFLYRFHKIYESASLSWTFFGCSSSAVSNSLAITKFESANRDYWDAVTKRILIDGPITIFINQKFGFLTAVTVLAVGYASVRRLRSFILPGAWFFSLAFLFNFGSTSLQFYKPFLLADRYLYPILLPAVILTSGLIDVLIPSHGLLKQEIRRERLFWGGTLVVCITLACLVGIYGNIRKGISSPVERTVSRMLKPDDPLYTDSRTAWVLNFFWKYPKEARTKDFAGMGIDDIPTEVYVLINRERVQFLNSNYGYVPPKFYDDVPRHWLLKWRGNHAELYWIPDAKTIW